MSNNNTYDVVEFIEDKTPIIGVNTSHELELRQL